MARGRNLQITAHGGDIAQPIALARPRQSVAEIRAELEQLGPRPSHKDILALTSWVQRRDRLVYLMVLAS